MRRVKFHTIVATEKIDKRLLPRSGEIDCFSLYLGISTAL